MNLVGKKMIYNLDTKLGLIILDLIFKDLKREHIQRNLKLDWDLPPISIYHRNKRILKGKKLKCYLFVILNIL